MGFANGDAGPHAVAGVGSVHYQATLYLGGLALWQPR
ncbi:MAG: hypothetical protein K0R62_7663 [Nonomuraea muscovyensis]|uniref:Uncharacterized protein n=1 Tax=Nonomuraea muscovyensis TaxID=1124761 RepID=A0A7X0EVC3_9ACTN|nr:hypothetical protein [Nonomuraea muscovyensis]MDF2712011.1 hypothetical protein [Nonomuraea muscovyensis]